MTDVIGREGQVSTECDCAEDGVRQAESLSFAPPFQSQFSSVPRRLPADVDVLKAVNQFSSRCLLVWPHAGIDFCDIDGTACQFMTFLDQDPKQFTAIPAISQGVDDHGTVQQNPHLRFDRMRRIDALSDSRRSFLTQAAAPPALSISG